MAKMMSRKDDNNIMLASTSAGEQKKSDSSFVVPPPSSSFTESSKPDEGTTTTDAPAHSSTSGDGPAHKSKKRNNATSSSCWILGVMLRFLFLELPLIAIFGGYMVCLFVQQMGEQYFLPQLHLQRFTPEKAESDITYYHRICTEMDQTAYDTSEFVVDYDDETKSNKNTTSQEDALYFMLKHGVAVLPNLLSEGTATRLREFILEENKVSKDLLYVIENESRWSFPIQVDQHPTVVAALEEMLNKPQLVDILETVVGKDPAVIEFTAITSAYGAVGQYWHQDVVPEGNAAKYGRNFVPSYSLFVPLQNVTSEMGATGICPGTHMCAAGTDHFCPETAFRVSGKANNWPMGAGALVNQQTTHRGEAHTDPNAPHRVVFILTFAPRPQSLPQTVETRMIGQQGSYSLHWSQWGHTLSDFQHPLQNMRQPWRTFRSLGMYKPKTRLWGWDYLSVSSCRIANDDTGFSREDLDSVVENNVLWWLPKRLYGGNYEDIDSNYSWVPFLEDTLKKCVNLFRQLLGPVLAVNIVFILAMALVSQGRRVASLASGTFRLMAYHGLIMLCIFLVRKRIENSTWAHNIQQERSFSVPRTLPFAPKLPSTLPTEQDILIFEGMQSDYFGSFNQILEVAHPGNEVWSEILSRYAQGYRNLPKVLQLEVLRTALREAELEQRRILVKNADSNWAKASTDLAASFCHRSLMRQSDHLLDAVGQQLDFLLSETRYGYWRSSSMHRNFVVKFIASLRDRIFDLDPMKPEQTLGGKIGKGFLYLRSSKGLPELPCETRLPVKRAFLAKAAFPEPLQDAWLQTGDVVEATYEGDMREWYRGRIVGASANLLTWSIVYDDGDELAGVCRHCVRPFFAYEVDENIEVRVRDDLFVAARIKSVHPVKDTVDVELLSDGDILPSVGPSNVRRVDFVTDDTSTVLAENSRVFALYPGAGDEWFLGRITRVNPDGTFSVLYDDGDFAPKIHRNDIELMRYQ